MNILPFIACLLLASCSAAPSDSNELVITEKYFVNDFLIYTGKHDIVKIFVPLNQFNFEDTEIDLSGSSGSTEEVEHKYMVFFVEADVTDNATNYQGLYVFKNGTATKLLDNGRDAVANHEKVVFFAAEDGLYKYNAATNTADKFGTITNNIIQLAHNNKTNAIYCLTEDHKVLKLNKDGDGTDEVPSLKDVQAMVFGFDGKMYYYDSKNNVYVHDVEVADSVAKKVEGLPSEFNKLTLISAMYGMEEGVELIVDDRAYFINPDATAKISLVKFEVFPTAFAPQPTLIEYFAKDKKIYEFNVYLIMLSSVFEELNSFVEKNRKAISSIKKASN